jgi:hypothetical protein
MNQDADHQPALSGANRPKPLIRCFSGVKTKDTKSKSGAPPLRPRPPSSKEKARRRRKAPQGRSGGNVTGPPEVDNLYEIFPSEGPEMNDNHAPSFFFFFRKSVCQTHNTLFTPGGEQGRWESPAWDGKCVHRGRGVVAAQHLQTRACFCRSFFSFFVSS